MQVFGTAYVAHVVKGQSAAYGLFAYVHGLLAWLFIVDIGVVISIELNVVRGKHLYPRALLTLFSDDADLTPADRAAYRDAAAAQRYKSAQQVSVEFDDPSVEGHPSVGEPEIRPPILR